MQLQTWIVEASLFISFNPSQPQPQFPFLLLIFQTFPSRDPSFPIPPHMSDAGTHTQWGHCFTISPTVCSPVCCCEKPERLKPVETI